MQEKSFELQISAPRLLAASRASSILQFSFLLPLVQGRNVNLELSRRNGQMTVTDNNRFLIKRRSAVEKD